MSKVLILKPRSFASAEDGKRVPTWHDAFVLQVAIESIATGKAFSKVSLWLAIAGKIQYALDSIEDMTKDLGEITVELRNVEARKLWEELCKLKPENFGRSARTGQPASPPPGTLYLMLADIGKQLGYEIPDDEDDEKEDDNDDQPRASG